MQDYCSIIYNLLFPVDQTKIIHKSRIIYVSFYHRNSLCDSIRFFDRGVRSNSSLISFD